MSVVLSASAEPVNGEKADEDIILPSRRDRKIFACVQTNHLQPHPSKCKVALKHPITTIHQSEWSSFVSRC